MSKINVIGLGAPGVRIANTLKKYSQYNIYKIDSEGSKSSKFYTLKSFKHPELYEKNPPKLKTFFRGMKGDVLFIVSGAGIVSGAALVILEQIRHCNITVLYIKPDTDLLSELRFMQERVVYNVLQEYTRSGVFKEMILINNPTLEAIVGDLPLKEYYNKLNETIVSTLHMINVFQNSDSIIDNFSPSHITTRITTLGVIDLKNGEENLFFPLENIREKCYYYGINRETLEEDKMFYSNLKEQIKNKRTGDIKVSYGIFSTNYNENYAFCVVKSSEIQK